MAGIYHNTELGIISMSSDGENWLTIADKNLGATQVYDGGTMSEETSGKFYQWGNNHGFPYEGSFTTSRTKVDASTYGPGNYYDGDVFITSGEGDGDWSSVPNDNLRGGVTGTVEAMQGPCSNGFHIPTKDEWESVIYILAADFDFAQNGETLKTYLKLPICGYRRSSDGMIQRTNNYGYYHTVTIATSGKTSYFLMTNPSVASTNEYTYHTTGGSIRPFKNEAEIPYADEGWTKLYGGDLPPRPVPPPPQKIIKRFQNSGNYYYFGEPPVHASGVTLNKSSLMLTETGQTEQLVATVTPSDAVEKSVTWTSSDTTVAKVYQDGTVECVNPGDCTITCTVNDGGYTASCGVSNKKNIDFLLIGGGGGGAGGDGAGGGGAGGFIACNNYKISDGNHRIHIGYGGGGSQCNGNDGQCSIFGDFTAYGGGGGGYRNCNGCPGGSGGGGGLCCCGGGACSGQGYSGGNSSTCYCGGGGGGGGAGGYGGYGSYTCGGYGGAGKYSDISGQGQWYAGGGSGISVYGNSMPACNGGTNASNNACCYAKATICGAGGGAHSIQNTQYGGGGCGLFIVRYKTSCGYNITGGTCYTCGDYTIHCFEYTNSVYRQYLCIN